MAAWKPSKMCVVCGREFVKPPSNSRTVWAKRQCCSRACGHAIKRGRPNPKLGEANRGRKQSPEANQRRSATLRRLYAEGKVHYVSANLGKRREETSQWKGDDITYRTAHARLHGERGKPTECELCGTTDGWIEWALKREPAVVKRQVGGVGDGLLFSPRAGDYFPLCRPCHRAYDRRKRDSATGRYL